MTRDTKVDQNECSICQEDLEVGHEIVFLPVCNHSFHNECLQRWFRLVSDHLPLSPSHLSSQQSWCPICRSEILTQSDSNDGPGSVSNRKMSNGWKANLNTSFEECEDDEEGLEAMMGASPYLIEGKYAGCDEDGEEEDEEETKSCSVNSQEKEEDKRSLRAVPSVESLMAKQTVDSVMDGVVSQLR